VRVKEVADLAHTSVRTVRYYHHVGLLPVPPAINGMRDYDLYHLARLLRIRWLVDSGLPLRSIREVLVEPGGIPSQDTAVELRQALDSVDARIATLTAQRNGLVALLEQADEGRLTPLPRALANLYDRLAAAMPNPAARKAVEGERHVMIYLAVHGLLPASLTTLVAEIDHDDEADTVAIFEGVAQLADLSGDDADHLIADLVDATRRIYRRHPAAVQRMLADLPQGVAGSAFWATVRRLAQYAFNTSQQRLLIDALARELSTEPGIELALAGSTSPLTDEGA
jgi:DNA-binding transcriptional MerR regulator